MKHTIAAVLIFVVLLVCAPASAAVGEAKVVTYDDDGIRSRICVLEHPPYYYAVDTTGYIRITCDGEPTIHPYGFQPPSMVGAIILRIHRTDTGTTTSQWGCGLLMLDGEDDGRLYVALDCRASAKRAVGRPRAIGAN